MGLSGTGNIEGDRQSLALGEGARTMPHGGWEQHQTPRFGFNDLERREAGHKVTRLPE